MKPARWILAAIAVAGLAAPIAWAEPADVAGVQAEEIFSGSISALNLEASSKAVEVTGNDGRVLSIALDPSTEILRNGQRVDPDKLKVGDQVDVSLDHRDGEEIAKRIDVKSDALAADLSAPQREQSAQADMNPDLQTRTNRDAVTTDTTDVRYRTNRDVNRLADRVERRTTVESSDTERTMTPAQELMGLRFVPTATSRPGASHHGPDCSRQRRARGVAAVPGWDVLDPKLSRDDSGTTTIRRSEYQRVRL